MRFLAHFIGTNYSTKHKHTRTLSTTYAYVSLSITYKGIGKFIIKHPRSLIEMSFDNSIKSKEKTLTVA